LHAAVKTIIDFETKNDETACSPQFISASSRRGGIKSRFVMQDITAAGFSCGNARRRLR
jgi:hypothetical protein